MIKKTLFFLASVCCSSSVAWAGAWVQPQGQGLFIANATYFTDNHYFNSDGDRLAQPRYEKYELQPYLEYGLLSNLTIGGSAGLQRDTQSDVSNYGIADPEIFLRSVIWQDSKQLFSLQPLMKFTSSFAKDAMPRGGSHSTDAELSLLYGRNLNLLSSHDYLDVRAGYRYRGNALHDQLRADAALGLEITPHWQIIPAIRTVTSTHLTNSAVFNENGDQDYDYVKLELGTAYKLNAHETVGLTVFDHVSGVQTGDGIGVTLSFAQQF